MKTKPDKQIYNDYTPEDFKVWRILYERQMETLQPVVSKNYLEALKQVNFTAGKIPDFKETNALLLSLTGWSIETVPNLCPQKDFFRFLSQRRFTSTCWLRSMEQLDYLEEPDMFHDVFGHIPLLSNQAYCDFFKGLSEIALQHIDNSWAIELLGRVYWYTIEFGLIREEGKLKIYGAGIISSHGETLHALSKDTLKLPFDVRRMLKTPYRNDVIQQLYFITDSFEQLYHSLPDISRELNDLLANEMKEGRAPYA